MPWLLLLILFPLVSLAADTPVDFVPLVGIPFVDTTTNITLSQYANALYIAAISLGAVLAVLKIILAGVKYMLTDVITDKSQAKKDIWGALLGLIIMIGAVLILNTVNPEITSLKALQLDGLTIVPQDHGGDTVVDSVGAFCKGYTKCETCDARDLLLCLQACASKEGNYSQEFNVCAHNKADPGVDIDDLDPDLSNQISGTVTQITGGRAQVDAAIANSGKTVLFQTGAYPSEEYHYTRRNNMQDCIDDGGSSYMVFYGPQSEMFVCFQ